MTIFLLADRSFKGYGLPRNFQDPPHLFNRHLHFFRKLLRKRFPAILLDKLSCRANQLIDRLDHMDRDTDRSRLICNGPSNRLPDPPCRICGEFEPSSILKLVNGFHQTDIAFLNQVQKLESPVCITLGDGDNKSQVGLDQFGFCFTNLLFTNFKLFGSLPNLICG